MTDKIVYEGGTSSHIEAYPMPELTCLNCGSQVGISLKTNRYACTKCEDGVISDEYEREMQRCSGDNSENG